MTQCSTPQRGQRQPRPNCKQTTGPDLCVFVLPTNQFVRCLYRSGHELRPFTIFPSFVLPYSARFTKTDRPARWSQVVGEKYSTPKCLHAFTLPLLFSLCTLFSRAIHLEVKECMQTIPPNVSRPWRWRGTQGEQRPTTPDEERWEEGAAVVGGKGGNGEHGEGKRAERVQEEVNVAQARGRARKKPKRCFVRELWRECNAKSLQRDNRQSSAKHHSLTTSRGKNLLPITKNICCCRLARKLLASWSRHLFHHRIPSDALHGGRDRSIDRSKDR